MTKWTKADDGTWEADDFPAFGVGKWNGGGPWEDPAFVRDLVERTNAAIDKLQTPLVPGHADPDLTAGAFFEWFTKQPRLGIFKGFRLAGDKVLASIRAVPQVVKDQIDAGLFGRLSIVIRSMAEHGGAVIHNVGLLGAAPPAVPYAGFAGEFAQFSVEFTTTDGSESATEGSLTSGESTRSRGEAPQEELPPSTAADETRQPLPEAKEGTLADESKAGVEALAEKERELAAMKARLEEQEKAHQEFAAKTKQAALEGAFARMLEEAKVTPAMKASFMAVGMELADPADHIASWAAREPMHKSTAPKSAGTPEEKVEQSFDERATAFAEKYVADHKGSFADGLGAFERTLKDGELKEYRAQFAGSPPADVAAAATITKGGK